MPRLLIAALLLAFVGSARAASDEEVARAWTICLGHTGGDRVWVAPCEQVGELYRGGVEDRLRAAEAARKAEMAPEEQVRDKVRDMQEQIREQRKAREWGFVRSVAGQQ